MNELKTNRDLYLAISQLIEDKRNSARTLEDYLRALLALGRKHQDKTALPVAKFLALIAEAFTAEVPSFDPAWKNLDDSSPKEGFEGWQVSLIQQIVDLHEMEEQGILNDRDQYFGVNSPRGRRWYNFDPCTFLECAMAGSYGGWQPGDKTGRTYVPGLVLGLGKDDSFESREPEEIEEPLLPLQEISWDDFNHFLLQGQYYE